MNEKEKLGCQEILKTVQSNDLLSLTDTVTKKLVKVSSRSEAIRAIITYSESACQLLTRKKLKRDILFKYLADKEMVTSVNSDKRTIIRKLLEIWGTKNIAETMKHYDTDVPPSSPSEDFTNPLQQTKISQKTCTTVSKGANNTHQVFTGANSTHQASKQTSELQLLGETFASWFYKVLNSNNPHMGINPEEFGPCHFWDGATLKVTTITDMQSSSDEFSGSQLVSEKILSFTKSECLLFNPNISREGILVNSEKHGLVIVIVCGTIHRQNKHLGVFDQMFGLVKDPRFYDNWKIKITKLKLHNIPVDHVPSLKDKTEREIKDLVAV